MKLLNLPSNDGSAQKSDPTIRRVGRNLSVKCADAVLDWFIFPSLLFIQFGATMYYQEQAQTSDMPWNYVMTGVALFCIIAVVYRKIYRIHPIQSLTILLLPEVFTNLILATVMFNDIKTAFLVLIVFTIVLSVLGGVGCIQISQHNTIEDASAGDYQRLHQEEDEDSDDEWVC
jgi:FtsH-binding integral membrane protein